MKGRTFGRTIVTVSSGTAKFWKKSILEFGHAQKFRQISISMSDVALGM